MSSLPTIFNFKPKVITHFSSSTNLNLLRIPPNVICFPANKETHISLSSQGFVIPRSALRPNSVSSGSDGANSSEGSKSDDYQRMFKGLLYFSECFKTAAVALVFGAVVCLGIAIVYKGVVNNIKKASESIVADATIWTKFSTAMTTGFFSSILAEFFGFANLKNLVAYVSLLSIAYAVGKTYKVGKLCGALVEKSLRGAYIRDNEGGGDAFVKFSKLWEEGTDVTGHVVASFEVGEKYFEDAREVNKSIRGLLGGDKRICQKHKPKCLLSDIGPSSATVFVKFVILPDFDFNTVREELLLEIRKKLLVGAD